LAPSLERTERVKQIEAALSECGFELLPASAGNTFPPRPYLDGPARQILAQLPSDTGGHHDKRKTARRHYEQINASCSAEYF
jgi:hypothetical protein